MHFHKINKLKLKLIHITILILLFATLFSCKNKSEKKIIENGIFDLSNDKFEKVYDLDGMWEFYWNELLTPLDIKNKKDIPDYIFANKEWNGFLFKDKKISGQGFATYRVRIIAPSDLYVLKIRQIVSSYKIWINNSLVKEVGKVDSIKQNAIPKVIPQEFIIYNKKDTIEIVIQVSNYNHRIGGIQEDISFGRVEKLNSKTTLSIGYSIFILGALLIFAMYFFISFFIRKKRQYSYLYFALAVISSLIFEIFNGEMIAIRFVSFLSDWELAKKLDFLGNYLRLGLFTLFFWSLFKNYKIINKYIVFIIVTSSLLLVFIVLFTPCVFFSKTLLPFMGISLFTFFYLLFITIVGLIKKVPHIIYSFLGMFVFQFAILNDIIYGLGLIDSVFMLNTGILIFYIFQSITLSLNFSKIEKDVDKMSSKEIILEQIRKEFSLLHSYNFGEAIKILYNKTNANYVEVMTFEADDYVCEAFSDNNKVICREIGEVLQPTIDNKLIIEFSKKNVIFQRFFNNNWFLSIPLFNKNTLKALIIFTKKTIFDNNIISIIEILLSQINVIYDNYSYFWNLENINKNLESIIENRSKLIHSQKDKLLKSTVELDEKIEELNVSAMIVDELNDDLLTKQNEIEAINQILITLKEKIEIQKIKLEVDKNNIASSIRYAVKIQNTIFKQTTDFFTNFFEFSSPKKTISGDFWTSFVIQNRTYVILIDAIGHDVTSTFLNFLLFSAIEDVLKINENQIQSTNLLLKKIGETYLQTLNYNKYDIFKNSIFDIGLISYDNKTTSLQFSGANINFSIARKGEIINFKPDNFSLCDNIIDKNYTLQKTDYKHNDIIYIYSDGFINQINKHNLIFGLDNFSNVLKSISNQSFAKQKIEIETKYNEWKKDTNQVDDFLILGLTF